MCPASLAKAITVLLLLLGCDISGCLSADEAAPVDLSEGLRQDSKLLLAFRREIERDLNGSLDDWGQHPSPCRWPGVECQPIQKKPTKTMLVGMPEVEERITGLELVGLELGASVLYYVGELSELRTLIIRGTKFKEGQIPAAILNCSKLVRLDLRGNQLLGQIKFSLVYFPILEVLRLSHNRLSGTLDVLFSAQSNSTKAKGFSFGKQRNWKRNDEQISICSHLKFLDVAHNSFSGRIPQSLGQCQQMQRLELQENAFTGSIPATLAIPKLRFLQLNNNHLDGRLPPALATGCGGGVQFLNVASNFLRGAIPSGFSELQGDDRRLYFSDNLFEGPIPLGKWDAEQMHIRGSFSGNPGLCGWPLDQVCQSTKGMPGERDRSSSLFSALVNKVFGTFPGSAYSGLVKSETLLRTGYLGGKWKFMLATSTRRRLVQANGAGGQQASPRKKMNSTLKRWLLGGGVGLIGGSVAALTFIATVRMVVSLFGKEMDDALPIIFHPKISSKMLRFLQKDDALVNSDVIGAGGAGKVYRLQLDNGMVVAVKSVEVKEDQKGFGQKHIQAELETLGCIRHRNLVALLAYVRRPQHHLLIYKFMQYGSLYQVLRRLRNGDVEVPWPTRHRIAVEVCEGLTYLHFHSKARIVHRDLKPSNILIDENFRAHVSDFGLAKVIGVGDNYVSTGLAGTVGYIAPEYSQTCRFTDRGDVYAFGVVLAGLITGKDPTEKFFQTHCGRNIGSWLQEVMLSEDAKSAVDPRLSVDEFEAEILLGIRVAVFCMSVNPADRPNSQQVLTMLKEIRPVNT